MATTNYCRGIGAAVLLTVAATQQVAADSDDYGGGWAVPSLETSISISNDIINSEIMARNLRLKSKSDAAPKSGESRPRRTARATKPVATKSPENTRAFNSIVAPYGLKASSPADTLAAYLVMAWVVANKAELPLPNAVQGVRAQMARGLTRTTAKLTPAQEGLLAEKMVAQFLRLNAAWRTASKDDEKYAALSDAVNNDLGKYELRSHVVGASGLARR